MDRLKRLKVLGTDKTRMNGCRPVPLKLSFKYRPPTLPTRLLFGREIIVKISTPTHTQTAAYVANNRVVFLPSRGT